MGEAACQIRINSKQIAMNPDVFRCPAPYSEFNLPRMQDPHFMTSEEVVMPKHKQSPRGKHVPTYKNKNLKHEDQDYYCELCDYDFTTKADYQKHLNEHRPCTIDQCKFIGHPDILPRHIEQQHKSGLYEKLKQINTPEEVTKWREDRKKRYPTRANVALRQQLQEARFRRGERLSENKARFGERKDRRKCRQHDSKDAKSSRRRRPRKPRRPNPGNNLRKDPPENVEEADPESDGEIKKFSGTSELLDYERPKKKGRAENALASLAGLYGSDDDDSGSDGSDKAEHNERDSPAEEKSNQFNISSDEEDHFEVHGERFDILSGPTTNPNEPKSTEKPDCESLAIETAPDGLVPKIDEDNTTATTANPPHQDSKATETISATLESQIPKVDSDDDDQQVEVPFEKVVETFSEEEKPRNEENLPDEKKSKKRTRQRRKPIDSEKDVVANKKPKRVVPGLVYSRLYRRPQNTMLEKLLHADIVHERNVLLQCVRYVVENKFFGIGQQSTT